MSNDRSATNRPTPPQWLIILAVWAVAAVVVALISWATGFWSGEPMSWGVRTPRGGPPLAESPAAIPAVAANPFKNAGPSAKFVGDAACAECHQEQHETFGHTGMGRSMAEVDLDREPDGGQFDHPLSKRRYEVRRRDGQMWHRELLLTPAGQEEVVLSEYPVKYVTGSGRHSLTYLAEIDGFLVESPITWYRSRNGWWMSPGYDRPEHAAFEREIGEGCLACHAGRAETLDRSLHRLRVVKAEIGCENCHGPGSLHVEARQGALGSAPLAAGEIDPTIANPAHLSRELAEAVCQQCHLRTSAVVLAAGKRAGDFRPGQPLQEIRHDYTLAIPDKPMTVVGHVEQTHLSRCYQESETFTCVSCHDPHREPAPDQREAYYREACLKCHHVEECTVDPARREKESASNHCVQCHMPTTPTDIPHLAFTHHRVGIYDKSPPTRAELPADHPPGELKPFLDLSRLTETERKRSLGLGYVDVAIHEDDPQRRNVYQRQALELLTDVSGSALGDGAIDAAIASLRFDLGMDGYPVYAQSALSDANISGMDRCNALFLVADAHYRRQRYHDAVAVLDTLSGLRRNSLQWLLRAECHKQLGNQTAMIEALETAARIRPGQRKIHEELAAYYRQRGDQQRAAWHERRAAP